MTPEQSTAIQVSSAAIQAVAAVAQVALAAAMVYIGIITNRYIKREHVLQYGIHAGGLISTEETPDGYLVRHAIQNMSNCNMTIKAGKALVKIGESNVTIIEEMKSVEGDIIPPGEGHNIKIGLISNDHVSAIEKGMVKGVAIVKVVVSNAHNEVKELSMSYSLNVSGGKLNALITNRN